MEKRKKYKPVITYRVLEKEEGKRGCEGEMEKEYVKNIAIEKKIHRELKIIAVIEGKRMKELINGALREYVERWKATKGLKYKDLIEGIKE